MSKDSKFVLAALAVVLAWSVYSHTSLDKQVRQSQQLASTCSCPQSNAAEVNGARIAELTKHVVSSHSYAEHLLEGLTRKNGLPIESARKAFMKSMEPFGGVPEGWRWLKVWETMPPVESPAP